MSYEILTKSNEKTLKSLQFGYETAILHLLPSDLSGYNCCPFASEGCSCGCLNKTGKGGLTSTQEARLRRTLLYWEARADFYGRVERDITRLMKRTAKNGILPCVRLNGTSDIPTIAIRMAEKFESVRFYDYTAVFKTLVTDLPENYHLTFSRKEDNEKKCFKALDLGFNVSVVFDKLPESMEFWGLPVIDGTKHDLRFTDPTPCIVGLKASGKALSDKTGFVVRGAK